MSIRVYSDSPDTDHCPRCGEIWGTPPLAAQPSEEMIRQAIKRKMLDCGVGRFADNGFDSVLAQAVLALLRQEAKK